MKDVKVLGTGCAKCKATAQLIEDVARSQGADIRLQKVDNVMDILNYGVMSTPGVVIDGKVVHAGGVPSRATVETWLRSSDAPPFPMTGRVAIDPCSP
jgi:small redox-active disulfide protein 2